MVLLLRHDTSSFKGMCFLTKLKEVPVALYGPYLQRYKPLILNNCPKQFEYSRLLREMVESFSRAEDIL
jgi:hypothetical protein